LNAKSVPSKKFLSIKIVFSQRFHLCRARRVNVDSEVVMQAIVHKWSMDYPITAKADRGLQMG